MNVTQLHSLGKRLKYVIYSNSVFFRQFVSHPLLYKRLDVRWNLGLPDVFKRHRFLLFLFILIDAFLTPFLLPIVAFAFHVDQKKVIQYLPRITTSSIRRACRALSFSQQLQLSGRSKLFKVSMIALLLNDILWGWGLKRVYF